MSCQKMIGLFPAMFNRIFKRDKGQCVECGSKDHLHFDHILPFSKGGTSKDKKNIRLLCRRHNLKKSNKVGG